MRSMCGRFALHAHPRVVALQFGLAEAPQCAPRYNIAPGADVLIVRTGGGSGRAAAAARWGFVPRWAKEPSIGARLKNARAETVAAKPAFRDAYRRRRCLVPASGYYEWKAEGARRQPWYIHPAGEELFAFAAIWERWNDLETCAILTMQANESVRAIHDRMPVVVLPQDYERWLGGAPGVPGPCPSSAIAARKVSRAVNSARNDSPALIEPVPA
jgi:putative SOS response-associated peptidase YedK